ncbi:hypothetical protein [uncultured Pontibacter sp.]|uniref:hypothetical protein n=1 Tax=uncultured Pontibacter sp. TaxID=453356 RepID=UPI00261BBB48|nr:hypothetical protein [uncultured Pontibacter sp.]
MKTNSKKGLYLLFIPLLIACSPDIEFEKEGWKKQVDGSYLYRDKMVNNLLKSQKLEGLPYDSLVSLLGHPEPYGMLKENETTYILVEDYGRDIDPVYVKLLKIKLSADSTVSAYEVVETK